MPFDQVTAHAPSQPPPLGRPRRWLPVIAAIVTVLSLVPAGFAAFMANFVTYGLGMDEPTLDTTIILPLVAVALVLPLGPLVMTLGEHRRTWLIVAVVVSGAGVLWASVLSWLPVALGLH